MNKKFTSALFLPLLLTLTSCSAKTDNASTPVNSAESVSSLLKNDEFDFVIDGNTGYTKENLTSEEVSYIGFNCAYISYGKPEAESNNAVMKIKQGDQLDNGLTVEWTNSVLAFLNGGWNFQETYASFKGELTLTGTLICTQEDQPLGGKKGDLSFKADAANEIGLPSSPQQGSLGFMYNLGNIEDDNLPEGITDIVNADGKETADVKVTISDIKVNGVYFKGGVSNTAVLVKVITE